MIKSFSKFNEELSPQTYDKVANVGIKRGDSRGKRLADTAIELKHRSYVGDKVTCRVLGLVPGRRNITDTIKEITTTSNSITFHLNETGIILVVSKNERDNRGGGGIIKIISDNHYYEVDRKTARLFSKAFKDFVGMDISPNEIAQM